MFEEKNISVCPSIVRRLLLFPSPLKKASSNQMIQEPFYINILSFESILDDLKPADDLSISSKYLLIWGGEYFFAFSPKSQPWILSFICCFQLWPRIFPPKVLRIKNSDLDLLNLKHLFQNANAGDKMDILKAPKVSKP